MVDTRSLILEAAKAELEASGVLGFRIKHVADVAGVAPATIYRYFSDRSGLIEEVIQLTATSSATNWFESFQELVSDVETPEELATVTSIINSSQFRVYATEFRQRVLVEVVRAGSDPSIEVVTAFSSTTQHMRDVFAEVTTLHPMRAGMTPTGAMKFISSATFGLLYFTDDERFTNIPIRSQMAFVSQFVSKLFTIDMPIRHSRRRPMLSLAHRSNAEDDPQSRRDELLVELTPLVMESDIQGLEMSELARSLQLPANALSHQFQGLDDLVGAVALNVFQKSCRTRGYELANLRKVFAEYSFNEIVTALGDYSDGKVSKHRIQDRIQMVRAFGICCQNTANIEECLKSSRAFNDDLISTFEILQHRGIIREQFPPELVARFLMGALLGQVVHDRDPTFQVPLEEWRRYFEVAAGEVFLKDPFDLP